MIPSIYKITIKQQVSFLTTSLLLISVFICALYFLFGWNYATIFTVIFIFITDTLPALILHILYLKQNWHSILIIDRSLNIISYRKKNYFLKTSLDNIQNIIRISAYTRYNVFWHSFKEYFYYQIIFEDGTEIIITCLMSSDIEGLMTLIFPKSIEKKLKVFPIIKKTTSFPGGNKNAG